MKRISCLLILLICILCVFASCGTKTSDVTTAPSVSTPATTSVTNAETGITTTVLQTTAAETTVPETTAEATTEPEPESPVITVNAENVSSYRIVYAEKAAYQLKTEVSEFSKAVLGGKLTIANDGTGDGEVIPERANEIVVGDTNRPGGTAHDHRLRKNDYVIFTENGRIYVLGGSDEATLAALEHFKSTYFSADLSTVSVDRTVNDRFEGEYTIRSLSLNGENVMSYTVVYPKNADLYTKKALEIFRAYLSENVGVILRAVPDDQVTSDMEYRILLGDTALTPNEAKGDALGKGKFLVKTDGKTVVLNGSGYYIGASLAALIGDIDLTNANADFAVTVPRGAEPVSFTYKTARSAIILIGDGMGYNTIDMSLSTLPGKKFTGADMEHKGEQKTESLTTLENPTEPTDSAAGGTALATGYKTYNGYIGLDYKKKERQNLVELAHSVGARTGVITTDEITGATPCAFMIHYDNRHATDILQEIIDETIEAKTIDWCAGAIGDALTTNTAEALSTLSAGGSSFFLMVEEGMIDKYSHNNEQENCIAAVRRFNDTIAYCMEFVMFHPDTVLILTADHECGGITLGEDGAYSYTTTKHTGINVPIYSMGTGTEIFNGTTVHNIAIAKFVATIFGKTNFGTTETYD